MRSSVFGCAQQRMQDEKNVEYKSYVPGYQTMSDLNDDSNSDTWPAYCGDKVLSNGQFHELYSHRTIADAYIGYHTGVVKQKILEHEAIFKSQLYELHRLYRVQRNLMDELKMIELEKKSMDIETTQSSCVASQKQDAQRQHTSSAFWLSGSGSAKDLKPASNLLTGKYQPNGVVSQCNAESIKDCDVEILDCIPSTSRRKLNLVLRADEYIDVEEPTYHSNSNKALGNPSHATNGRCDYPPTSTTKMYLGRSVEINSGGDRTTLSKDQNGWADLNWKVQLQENNLSSPNVLGRHSSFQSNHRFSSKSLVKTFPRELFQAPHPRRGDSCGSSNGCRTMVEWPHMLGSARTDGQTMAYSQNLMSEKVKLYNKGQGGSFFQSDRIKADYFKEGSGSVPKHSVSGIDFFNRLSNPHQLDHSFSTSNGPWERSGVTQKSATAETHPCFNPTVTLPQQSWDKSIHQNGFYKEPYLVSGPAGSDYFNRKNGSFVASCLSNGLGSQGENSMKGIDLNVVSIGDCHNSVDGNEQGCVSDLQWLKSTNGVSIPRLTDGSGSSVRTLGVPPFGESHLSKGNASSCRSSVLIENEMDKIGRVRGFDMNLSCDSEEKDTEPVAASGRNFIDLNVCLIEDDDADMTSSAPGCNQLKTSIRGFDLEAPGEIEEDIFQTKRLRRGSGSSDDDLVNSAAEAIVGISSFRKLTLTQSPVTNPLETTQKTLKWFVDEISPLIHDDLNELLFDKTGDDREKTESLDYFEYMTLQLAETTEDDYLPDYPKPPESEELTGAGLLTIRTRKGQARRGRPRRDFQRDILPGLTSLARHEITEDLHTFGGLMRDSGHSWPSGITRARPRRGRPRLTPVQSPNPAPSPPVNKKTSTSTTTNTEHINTEDHRSLTTWGKTTRRPRRQRYPTVNVSVLHIA